MEEMAMLRGGVRARFFSIAVACSLGALAGCGAGSGTGSVAEGGAADAANGSPEASAQDGASSDGGTGDDGTRARGEAGGAEGGPDDAGASDLEAGGAEAGMSGIFYVATSGSDAADGSLVHPWKTISHAMSSVPAGATVMVRAGVYGEQVNVTVSGKAGAPVTLQSYPGELGIIDGTGVAVVDGAGLLDIDSQSHLVIRGLEIRNWKSTSSAVPAGVFVQGSATDVQILENHVHDIATMVESCNGVGGNAFGVAVYGNGATPISALIVRGNELDHLRTGCSESLTINGNVDGFEVSNNVVHDNDNIGIDVIGYEGTAPSPTLDMARNGAVLHNTVYNITSQNNDAYKSLGADGIYVDGGQAILIEQNVVYAADLGIEITSEHAGHTASYVLARNNVVYYSNLAGVSVGGYDASVGGTDHCAIVNNTLYDDAAELSVNYYVSDVLYENNLVYNETGAFIAGATTGVSVTHDLDLQTGAAMVFVNAGSPPQGAVSVDLHVAAATLAQVKGKGIAIACPSGWACPAIWGPSLNGTLDAAGSPRVGAAGIDIGAYESP